MTRGEFGGMEHVTQELEEATKIESEAPNDARDHEPVRYVIDDEPASVSEEKTTYQPRKTRRGLWSALALMTGLGFAGEAQAGKRGMLPISHTTSERSHIVSKEKEEKVPKLDFTKVQNLIKPDGEALDGKHTLMFGKDIDRYPFLLLTDKFALLHEDDILSKVYETSRGKLENYQTFTKVMWAEFKHTRLAVNFTDQMPETFLAELPKLKDQDALRLFNEMVEGMQEEVGVRAALNFIEKVAEKAPAQKPLGKMITEKYRTPLKPGDPRHGELVKLGVISPGENITMEQALKSLLQPGKSNSLTFFQKDGFVVFSHHAKNNQEIKLDTFPGYGGPEGGARYGDRSKAHQAVETPHGNDFSVSAFVQDKLSRSWQGSWIRNSAPLREAKGPKGERAVEYQTEAGDWRLATGTEAVFLNGLKPFSTAEKNPKKKKENRELFDAAKLSKEPKQFAVNDFTENGKDDGPLRKTYARNDFGSLSTQIYSPHEVNTTTGAEGTTLGIWFHSSPMNEIFNKAGERKVLKNGEDTLALRESHGCIHVYPKDAAKFPQMLAPGSTIRITSFEKKDAYAARSKGKIARLPVGNK